MLKVVEAEGGASIQSSRWSFGGEEADEDLAWVCVVVAAIVPGGGGGAGP